MIEITIDMLRNATPDDIHEGNYIYVQNELDEEIYELKILIVRNKYFFTTDGYCYKHNNVYVLKEQYKAINLLVA